MARLLLELATSDEDQLKDALEVLQQHPTQVTLRIILSPAIVLPGRERLNAGEFHTIKGTTAMHAQNKQQRIMRHKARAKIKD